MKLECLALNFNAEGAWVFPHHSRLLGDAGIDADGDLREASPARP